ncbi:MAG: DEAD/DEAH box helicase [Lewinellaceae bacterium]|nr:DEAD/DEAH box helicase [Lewinellaceae bacterium]
MKFSELKLHPSLMDGLDAMGFEEATPVQEKAIPLIMEHRDILACAQTGTGKTAAFLLPILHELCVSPSDHIDTIILEPTRELVVQVDQQLEGFSYFTDTSAIAIYGGRDGHSMEMEKRALKQGAAIIVATPGRLIAHLDLGYVKLDKLRHLILDEADRMLDMGFAPDLIKIVNMLPRKRQTLLFSATMPAQIRRFANEFLTNPAEVSIAISKPAEKIVQSAYDIEDEGKIDLVERLLQDKENLERVLIFAGTKLKVRQLADRLQRRGLSVVGIQSDLDQNEREERLLSFRNGNVRIVVATDVLSRGIDIKGIDLVINFDVPGDPEDYVHRIGRTGRADADGQAITLINRKDRYRFQRIEQLMEKRVPRSEVPEDIAQASRGNRQDSSSRGRGRNAGPGGRSQSRGPRNNRPQRHNNDRPANTSEQGNRNEQSSSSNRPPRDANNSDRQRSRGGRNRRRGSGGNSGPEKNVTPPTA